MAVDDEHERDLAQLPQRSRTSTTRTDGRSLPREVTAVTRPLFTADESDDDERNDDDDDDDDLFDTPQATAADAAASDATELSLKRPQHTAVNHGDDDDDDEDEDDDDDGVEHTVVSLVLPDHLRDPSRVRDNDDDDDGNDAFDDGAPTQLSIVPRGVVDDDQPRLPEAPRARAVEATKTLSARPGWQLAAMAVGAVVVLAVCVVVVAAIAFTPAAAGTPES